MKFLLSIVFLAAFPACHLFSQDPVKIGLLIQDKNDLAALHGAELALKIANQSGGMNGTSFLLITKSMEGPWGTGSKQAIELIWNDGVCVILGSNDGRNAHLVEQASAKSIVPFVSAWTSDPTLSQAFIPWFFNCVPNDEQQAEALIKEIFDRKKFKKVIAVIDNSYDSKQALKGYLKYSQINGKLTPLTLNFEDFHKTPESFISTVRSSGTDCIILFTGTEPSSFIIRLFKKNGIMIPVYASFHALNENRISDHDFSNLKSTVIVPIAGWSKFKMAEFEESFRSRYGTYPGPVAAFAYDAMSMIIEAIRSAGNADYESIRKAIKEIKHDGITGIVQFGVLGERLNACKFL